MHAPGFIAETDDEAVETLWPYVRKYVDRLRAERGGPPRTRGQFEADIAAGSWHGGSPATVATKIVHMVKTLGVQRFDLNYTAGTLPHEHSMNTIRLYGTEVVPRLWKLVTA